jgi:hypothetical protein
MGGAQCKASSGARNGWNKLKCTNQSRGDTFRGRHNRARASNLRKSCDFTHVIRLIDVNGNQRMVRWKGQMQTTSHRTVLKALLHHAIFGNGNMASKAPMHAWSIDDTGTLDTTGMASSSNIDALE